MEILGNPANGNTTGMRVTGPISTRCQLKLKMSERYMETSNVLLVISASLAMVGAIARKQVRIVHYIRKGFDMAVDIDIIDIDSLRVCECIGGNFVNDQSPLHVLAELRHLYKGAAFRIFMKKPGLPPQVSECVQISSRPTSNRIDIERHTSKRQQPDHSCSLISLPRVMIDTSPEIVYSTFSQNVSDARYSVVSELDCILPGLMSEDVVKNLAMAQSSKSSTPQCVAEESPRNHRDYSVSQCGLLSPPLVNSVVRANARVFSTPWLNIEAAKSNVSPPQNSNTADVRSFRINTPPDVRPPMSLPQSPCIDEYETDHDQGISDTPSVDYEPVLLIAKKAKNVWDDEE